MRLADGNDDPRSTGNVVREVAWGLNEHPSSFFFDFSQRPRKEDRIVDFRLSDEKSGLGVLETSFFFLS